MVESEQLKLPSHLPYVQPYTVAIMQTNRVSHDSYNVHGLFDIRMHETVTETL